MTLKYRELPIIFSGPMVMAILDGRTSQTRRVVQNVFSHYVPALRQYRDCIKDVDGLPSRLDMGGDDWELCPYGLPGDRLYVREAWRPDETPDEGVDEIGDPVGDDLPGIACIRYRADDALVQINNTSAAAARWHDLLRPEETWPELKPTKWRSSIHMPKWAARIWLEVTGVRVERLQDISEEDAKAEGAFFTDYGRRCGHQRDGWRDVRNCPRPDSHHPQRNGWAMEPTTGPDQCLSTARWAFANLWESLNAKRAPWDSNPWVWVISFRKITP